MKLHSIELRNFRGVRELVLSDLPETGVVVVHGPNEQGKSSIAEALNLALMQPAKTGKRAIKAILPAGSMEPAEVTVDLTLDGYRFTVDKRYTGSQSGKCLVTVVSPARNEFRDKAADDWLQERVTSAGVTDLWTAFTAEQGQDPNDLKLDSVTALSQALETKTDVEGVAVDEEALLTKVRQEADAYFTPGWNYTKTFQEKLKKPEILEAELTELQTQRRSLDRDIDMVEEGNRRLAELKRRIPALSVEVETTAEKLQAAKRVAERAAAAQERVEAAQRTLTEATDAVARREGVISALADREDQLAAATAAEEVATADSEAAAQKLEQAGKDVERLTSERDLVRDTVRIARHDEGMRRRKADATAARERLEKIDKLQTSLSDALSHAATFTITPAQLDDLVRAESDARTAKALLEAESVTLQIRADDKRTVTVDGEDVAVPVSKVVTADMVLVIDGVEVTIAPPSGSDRVEEVAATQAEVDRLLDEMKVDTVDDARLLVKEREAAEADVAAIRQRFDDATAGVDQTADGALVKRVDEEEIDRAEFWSRDEPIPDNAADRVDELEAELRGLEDDLAVAVATRDAVKNSDNLERRHRAVEAAKHAAAEVERARAELEARREEISDEALQSQVSELTETLAQKTTAAEELTAEMQQADPTGAEDDHNGAQSALESARRSENEWNVKVAAVQTNVDGAIGLDDRIRVLSDQLENAREVAGSELERADALKLLHDTLSAAREEIREAYQEPLREKLRALAKPVFGQDVDFTLDQGLAIVERTMNGISIPVDDLSGGAKEQLDILTRLAAAALIDGGAPVILDDALGFSDRGRLDQMNRAITRAGKYAQVLVLTCDEERYSRLDARREDIGLLLG